MDDTQRSQIRDNARYLREVRPIDPEEIHEYVEGTPHPAAVRQVLRAEATRLGLIERADGRFEPAPDRPLSVEFDGVDRLPESVTRRVAELLVEAFGPGWPNGRSGDRLRNVIRDFKRQYLHGGTVTYDRVTALGYAIYHVPSYFAAIQYVLGELAADDLLASDLRVLDVGAGVGGPALGLDAFVPENALVDYHALEPSEAVSVLRSLLEETGRNVHTTVHERPVEVFEPTGSFDLILCANVLSELSDPVAVGQKLLDWLEPDGTLVAIAPADRNTATGLREIERELERTAGATVYAPTVRLWPDASPESECWSFDRKPPIDVPSFQRRLDEGDRSEQPAHGPGDKASDTPTDTERSPGSREFVNADVQYAVSLLRTDDTVAVEYTPDQRTVARMAEMDRHVTDRIDCVAIKLSHDLSEGGNPLFLIGDGSERTDHFAVLTDRSGLNGDLVDAGYGGLLWFENVLVLWNEAEGAYNLVVDGETIVDRQPA
jgi:SAM-dependent methyltransferase